MPNIAVIYKSKYGFTQKYAQWMAKELNADLLEADRTKQGQLQAYDVIVYGGGIYAGGVNGISFITKHFKTIRDKELFLFTVGASDATSSKNTDTIRNMLYRVLTPEMQEKIKVYHLRGGLDYPRMNLLHRVLMWLMVRMVRKKPESELGQEEKEMLRTYGQYVDFTDYSTAVPLLEAVRGIQ